VSKYEPGIYYIDGEPVAWGELIRRAQEIGYSSPDGFYCTSEASDVLRRNGHDVSPMPPKEDRE
jgi:hypothetical protein